MKKKHKIILLAAVLLAVIAAVSVLLVLHRESRIQATRVEKIELEGRELSRSESAEFIRLFNAAEYKGEGIGDGGTPEYIFYVWNRDGSYLIIREFGGKERNFEISELSANGKKAAWYYVYSKKLEAFAEKLLNKD